MINLQKCKGWLILIAATALMSACKKESLTPADFNPQKSENNGAKISWYTPVTVSDAGTQVPLIRGIHVGTDWYSTLSPAVYQNADISSVSLYCFWKYLNPSYKVYDWTRLDAELTAYSAAGKNVCLVVAAGCRCPDWIFSRGVRHFTITEHHGGSGTTFTKEQPVVYDSAYVSLFNKFINALAKHMKTQPYWNKLTHIDINGINRTTDEFRLPAENGSNGSTNSVALWLAKGYTPEKVITAFQSIMQVVASAFPNRILDIAYIQDQSSAFPAIGTTNVCYACFTWLKTNYPDRVLARYTAVDAGYIPYNITVTLINDSIMFAGELSESQFANTANKSKLKDAIQAGINANAMYIELFPDNVTRFPDVIATYSPQVYRRQ